MVNNFYQESDLINSLKCKKRIAPTLVKGIDSLASLAEGSLVFGIGVYYGDSYDEKASLILSLWLDYKGDLLQQAEQIIRLTRKGKKQSKVGIMINSFIAH